LEVRGLKINNEKETIIMSGCNRGRQGGKERQCVRMVTVGPYYVKQLWH